MEWNPTDSLDDSGHMISTEICKNKKFELPILLMMRNLNDFVDCINKMIETWREGETGMKIEMEEMMNMGIDNAGPINPLLPWMMFFIPYAIMVS